MKKSFLAVLLYAAAPMGCGDDNPGTQPDAAVTPDTPPTGCAVTPGAWSAPNFMTNAADALALRARLDLLVGMSNMQGAEKGEQGVMIDSVEDLEAVYNGGTPALSAYVHPGMDPVIDDAFAEFIAVLAAGPEDLVVDGMGWTGGTEGDGGLYTANRIGFNAGAIEVRQIVDKGLFAGGAFYHYALKQTEGTITEATVDAIAAAWGSNATLDSTQGVRTDSAHYSFAMGFHADIAKALTEAKAYAADSNCTAERDAALRTVFRKWEQAMLARAFFYANKGDTDLAAAGADDTKIAAALHGFAEGIGLAIGFYGLPNPTSGPLANAGRTITDADLDAIFTALGVNRTDLEASTVGTFVTDSSAFNAAVEAFATRLKQVYQLSDAEIDKYRAASTPG